MRKVLIIVLMSLVVLSNTACAAGKKVAQTEAEKVAQTFWESHLSKCGDSYVAAQPSDNQFIPKGGSYVKVEGALRFIQIVGVKFVQAATQLSDADRLNGVEWTGDFYVTATARRDYDPQSVASGFPPDWSWRAWTGNVKIPNEGIFHFRVTKIRGKWLADNGSSGYGPVWEALETFNGVTPLSKAPCDTFPAR